MSEVDPQTLHLITPYRKFNKPNLPDILDLLQHMGGSENAIKCTKAN